VIDDTIQAAKVLRIELDFAHEQKGKSCFDVEEVGVLFVG
jgi:hypothetical protein